MANTNPYLMGAINRGEKERSGSWLYSTGFNDCYDKQDFQGFFKNNLGMGTDPTRFQQKAPKAFRPQAMYKEPVYGTRYDTSKIKTGDSIFEASNFGKDFYGNKPTPGKPIVPKIYGDIFIPNTNPSQVPNKLPEVSPNPNKFPKVKQSDYNPVVSGNPKDYNLYFRNINQPQSAADTYGLKVDDYGQDVSAPEKPTWTGWDATANNLAKGTNWVMGNLGKIGGVVGTGLSIYKSIKDNAAAEDANERKTEYQNELGGDIKASYGQDAAAIARTQGNQNFLRMKAAMNKDPNNKQMLTGMYASEGQGMYSLLGQNRSLRTNLRDRIQQIEDTKVRTYEPWLAGVMGGIEGVGSMFGLGGEIAKFSDMIENPQYYRSTYNKITKG